MRLGLLELCTAILASFATARPNSDSVHHHRRRGIAPLPSPVELQQTLDSFKDLQEDLSRSVLAIDTPDNSQTLSYEIKPLDPSSSTQRFPPTQPPTSSWQRPHKLRHHGRRNRHRPSDDVGFRINANVHSNEHNSFSRSLSDSGFTGFLRPQKGCPSLDGRERLMCPSRSESGYHVCIHMDQLCNHRPDCPQGEDENALNCLFYRTTMGHFKKVVDAVVSLTDHMVKAEESHREL